MRTFPGAGMPQQVWGRKPLVINKNYDRYYANVYNSIINLTS